MPTATDDQQPQKLGAMIDTLFDLREKRRDLDAESKAITGQMTALEVLILAKQDEEETTRSSGKKATATITEEIVPDVEDWDEFYQYVKDNDAFYLLQRRLSAKPFRETIEAGDGVNGVKPVLKRKISLRKD